MLQTCVHDLMVTVLAAGWDESRGRTQALEQDV